MLMISDDDDNFVDDVDDGHDDSDDGQENDVWIPDIIMSIICYLSVHNGFCLALLQHSLCRCILLASRHR